MQSTGLPTGLVSRGGHKQRAEVTSLFNNLYKTSDAPDSGNDRESTTSGSKRSGVERGEGRSAEQTVPCLSSVYQDEARPGVGGLTRRKADVVTRSFNNGVQHVPDTEDLAADRDHRELGSSSAARGTQPGSLQSNCSFNGRVQPVLDTDGDEEEDSSPFPADSPHPDGLNRSCSQSSVPSDSDSDSVFDARIKSSLQKLKELPVVFCLSGGGSACVSEASTDSSETFDCGRREVALGVHLRSPAVLPECPRESCCAEAAGDVEGMVYGNNTQLAEYLSKLPGKPRGSGIHTWDGITPALKKGLQYQQGEQFQVEKTLKQDKAALPYGVFLCRDSHSQKRFVLKKIDPPDGRLVGTEFLVKHSQPFLPKVYGVYKEKNVVWIFLEFIVGVTVIECDWNLRKLHQFAGHLLSACRYLHQSQLAHCDLKLLNVMVRDPASPDTLVIIDFESARHPDYLPFTRGEHTVTYLPPWHEAVLGLERFKPVLWTADLWALACVLVPFLQRTDSHDHHPLSRTIWAKVVDRVQQSCPSCRPLLGPVMCWDQCRNEFLYQLKTQGHEILSIHLGTLMTQSIDDADWLSLRRLLEYLTDTTNVAEKNIHTAIRIFNEHSEGP
ncbi:hypothetical protein ACOMHN_011577 [Nucella lapillus]